MLVDISLKALEEAIGALKQAAVLLHARAATERRMIANAQLRDRADQLEQHAEELQCAMRKVVHGG